MEISEKIRHLYKSKGLTIESLAKELNITQPGFSKMLKTNDFKISALQKIANILDVPITYFFEDNEREDILTEKQLFQELEKQRLYYETIITERVKGISLYYSLAKAFLKVLYFILTKKLSIKDVSTTQLSTIAERFFAIDINKLYGLEENETNDAELWFKHLTNKKDKNTFSLNLDEIFKK
ncbi:MAG: helix-turn-helix domain-containing protein [Bacteroidales bacterium]|nr:helix-turn-helix domain-containing protein [Bacteroidales bacterium]